VHSSCVITRGRIVVLRFRSVLPPIQSHGCLMSKPKRMRPAFKAMIVAPQPEATEAGLSVLEAGGNALDAVLACAFAQGVVDPMMCGIGGIGILHLYDPASGKNLILDGSSTCPAASGPEMWTALFER